MIASSSAPAPSPALWSDPAQSVAHCLTIPAKSTGAFTQPLSVASHLRVPAIKKSTRSAKEGDGAGEKGLGERGSRAQQRVQVDAGLGPVLHSPAYSGYFLLSRIAAADCAGRGNRACVGRSRAAAVCSLELQHDAAIYCSDNNAHGQEWYGCRLRNIALACPSRALRLEFVSVRLFSRSRSMSMHVSGASMQEGTHATVCWSAGF